MGDGPSGHKQSDMTEEAEHTCTQKETGERLPLSSSHEDTAQRRLSAS